MSEIKLGDVAKDTITGFTGVVLADTMWLNGCRRLLLQPQDLRDGKPVESLTFDVEQLELVTAKQVPAPAPHGGDRPNIPRGHATPMR